jgi:hypothetical protein
MDPTELLTSWKLQLRVARDAHYIAAKRLERRHYLLGVPIIVLSALVAACIFADLPRVWSIAVAVAALISAVLASLQLFIRFVERAERHRHVATRYGALIKSIDESLAFSTDVTQQERLSSVSAALRKTWDDLTADAPTIPARIWNQVNTQLKAQLPPRLMK